MNERQIKIIDILLKHLASHDGKSSLDDYPEILRKSGFEWYDVAPVRDFLIENTNLITFWGSSDYWIMLTNDGYQAAHIGFKNYLKKQEDDKELDRNAKKASIKGVDTAKKLSIIAIVISVLIPILLKTYERLTDSEILGGNEPLKLDKTQNLSDSVLIEEIKYKLKHDTIFLNDLKGVILSDTGKIKLNNDEK